MSAYAEGIIDGFRIVLSLLDGRRAEGGVPYMGPKPPELERWIEQALRRLDPYAALDRADKQANDDRDDEREPAEEEA